MQARHCAGPACMQVRDAGQGCRCRVEGIKRCVLHTGCRRASNPVQSWWVPLASQAPPSQHACTRAAAVPPSSQLEGVRSHVTPLGPPEVPRARGCRGARWAHVRLAVVCLYLVLAASPTVALSVLSVTQRLTLVGASSREKNKASRTTSADHSQPRLPRRRGTGMQTCLLKCSILLQPLCCLLRSTWGWQLGSHLRLGFRRLQEGAHSTTWRGPTVPCQSLLGRIHADC
jgi:hypothetical protein